MTTTEQNTTDHDPHLVKLSNRQRRFLRDGLRRLGLKSYREYLRSERWYETRTKYWKSALPQKCVVCYDPNVELHHRTYQRLGRERLTDLLPLCSEHHNALHSQPVPLWNGHHALIRVLKLGR